jgi:hypothetical protein
MRCRRRLCLPSLLPLLLTTTAALLQAQTESRSATTRPDVSGAPPVLTILSPASGDTVKGVRHSTTDPIVLTPLSAGPHTVRLELADAKHRPLETRTVRFTIAPSAMATTIVEPRSRFDFMLPSGGMLPTGALRMTLKDAAVSAAQLSLRVYPRLALTTTLAWTRSRDIATVGRPKVDLFSYDIGAEAHLAPRQVLQSLTFNPFVGAGAGARSYNYRAIDQDATHNATVYGSLGGDVGIRRVRLRVEARDYVAGFKPLNGVGTSSTHNDVVVLFGLNFVRNSGAHAIH